MDFNGGKPYRRRLSAGEMVQRDHRIWQARAEGFTAQQIADAEHCGLASVDRSLKRLLASPIYEFALPPMTYVCQRAILSMSNRQEPTK
jgi:hypothetical protein